MALFQNGQIIVYENVGVCRVENVGPMDFMGGKAREYYTLRPLFTSNNDRIYIPTSTEAFMRPVIGAEEAGDCLETMKNTDVTIFCCKNQSLLMEHYQELMQRHSIREHMKLFKEICQKEHLQKSKGRKLNAVDQHFYKLTEQLLSEELAVSLQQSPGDMRKKLRAAAAA